MRAPTPDCERCPLGLAARPGPCPLRPTVRPAGALLVRPGEAPENAWLVRRGHLLVTASSRAGEETLCLLRSGRSFVGIEALRHAPVDYEAWTLDRAQLCQISAEELRRWLGGDDRPSPARVMVELLLDELMRSHEERMSLAGGAVERVARFLHARLRGNGAALTLQQQLLARVLRIRPETLSRALHRLRAAGAIGKGRRVRVLDPLRLAQFMMT